MKYIGFFEFCLEDFDKVIPKFQEAMKEREKKTDKFLQGCVRAQRGLSPIVDDNSIRVSLIRQKASNFYYPLRRFDENCVS